MSTNTYYIERDDKLLKSFDELKDWYIKKVQKHKTEDDNFNELSFANAERLMVINLLNGFTSTDFVSEVFKRELFEYWVTFLYTIGEPVFNKQLNNLFFFNSQSEWFNLQYILIKDDLLKEAFIKRLIDIKQKKYDEIVLDINSYDNQEIAEKRFFLDYLYSTITFFQHTDAASGHENFINENHQFYSYGIPINNIQLLLAEKLENRLLLESVAYKSALDSSFLNMQIDKEYFKKFIPGRLYNEFIQMVFDCIQPLGHNEINKYLTLSLTQFAQYNPLYREKDFNTKFARAYDNILPGPTLDLRHLSFVKDVLNEFANHYSIFFEAAKKTSDDFNKGIIKALPQTAIDVNSIEHLFNKIKDGGISQIEIYNKVDKITDNFNLSKISILLDDFNYFLMKAQYEKGNTYEILDEVIALEKLEEANKEIPFKKPPFTIYSPTGLIVIESDDHYDFEAILYPQYFTNCYQFKNFLVTEINKRKTFNPPPENLPKPKVTFESLLTQSKQEFILKMLEDLSITKDGKSIIGARSKSQLLGIVLALLEKSVLPKQSEFFLCAIIGHKIGLNLTSKLDQSNKSDDMYDKALKYITNNYKT